MTPLRPTSNDDQTDVLIAAYAMGTLAESDYEAIVDLVEAKTITTKGVLMAMQDAVGETQVKEVTEVGEKIKHKKGPLHKVGGKLEEKVGGKLEEKMGEKLSPGSGMMIVIYDHSGADSVAVAIQNPMWTSMATVDGHSPKALKAGLEEASAGLPG